MLVRRLGKQALCDGRTPRIPALCWDFWPSSLRRPGSIPPPWPRLFRVYCSRPGQPRGRYHCRRPDRTGAGGCKNAGVRASAPLSSLRFCPTGGIRASDRGRVSPRIWRARGIYLRRPDRGGKRRPDDCQGNLASRSLRTGGYGQLLGGLKPCTGAAGRRTSLTFSAALAACGLSAIWLTAGVGVMAALEFFLLTRPRACGRQASCTAPLPRQWRGRAAARPAGS